jgi:hypothetical protein
MVRRKLRSAFLPRHVRNVLHGSTVLLAPRDAFSSSCLRQAYQALESRRQEQHTAAFQQAYALRAGSEGTISQGARLTRMRRSPYRGERKTHLHHVQSAAGINVLRIITHLHAQAQGEPSRSSSSSHLLCSSQGGGSTVTVRCLNTISQQSH